MTERITEIVLDDFQRLTSYDIRAFFGNYIEFTEEHYSNIVNFFSGNTSTVPANSFEKLSWLTKEYKKIIDVVTLNTSALNNYEYWIVLEHIEDIGHALETANNASKWLRSSITFRGYKQKVVTDYMASQGQGLEQIERNVLRSDNYRDRWVETALENQLREEDYSLAGGYLIKVIYKNNASIFLNGVVDNIDTPEKTYGLDIDKNIIFENDDIKVLGYRDTIMQCAQILTDLKRGDDQAFPERGVDVKSIVGGNLAAVSYPAIFRDLGNNFATDDSFKSFSVKDVRRQQDAIMLDFEVVTRTGDVFSQSSPL